MGADARAVNMSLLADWCVCMLFWGRLACLLACLDNRHVLTDSIRVPIVHVNKPSSTRIFCLMIPHVFRAKIAITNWCQKWDPAFELRRSATNDWLAITLFKRPQRNGEIWTRGVAWLHLRRSTPGFKRTWLRIDTVRMNKQMSACEWLRV